MNADIAARLLDHVTNAITDGSAPNEFARSYARRQATRVLELIAKLDPVELQTALGYLRADDIPSDNFFPPAEKFKI